MKRMIFTLATALMLCTAAYGAEENAIENDSVNNAAATEVTVADTVGVAPASAVQSEAAPAQEEHPTVKIFTEDIMETIVVITAITFTFGMPVLIIFIIFHFRHKKRAAKYRLAEQMMASGQPLPKNFLEEEKPKDMRTKGISNVFLGIGLFILLWAITGEFGIGCVGLFIMLIGAGQLVIHHTQEKKEQNPSVPTPYEHRGEEEDARIDGFEITGHPANEE